MKNKVILDPTTTLTAEEFKQMRDGYESGVRKRVKEAKERKRMKIAKEKANQLLFGVPTSCLSFIFFFFFERLGSYGDFLILSNWTKTSDTENRLYC